MNPPHEDVRTHREWLHSFIDLPPGGTVVDLGCGTGADLLALAARHADPDARFLGLDASEKLLSAAEAAAAGDPRVSFRHERISRRLPLVDGSVDAVFSHNLLECLADHDGFAREVGRVLRPGGVAVIAHWDFDSQILDAGDRDAVRRLVHAFADWRQPWMEHADGWMGRRLWGTFAPTELFDGKPRQGFTSYIFACRRSFSSRCAPAGSIRPRRQAPRRNGRLFHPPTPHLAS